MSDFPSAEGQYTVKPIWRLEAGEWQDFRAESSNRSSLIATVSDGMITFSEPTAESGTIRVSNLKATSTPCAGNDFSASATVAYSGYDFLDSLRAVVLSANNEILTKSEGTVVALSEGESTDISFFITAPEETGTYTMAVLDGRGHILQDTTINVVETPTGDFSVALSDVVVHDADNVDRHDLVTTFTLICTSGYFNTTIWGLVYEPDSAIFYCDFAPDTRVCLAAGDTATITLRGEIIGTEPAMSYTFAPCYLANNGHIYTFDDQRIPFTTAAETTAIEAAETAGLFRIERGGITFLAGVKSVSVCSLGGSLIYSGTPPMGKTVNISSPGVYVVTVDGEEYKVKVE